MDVTPEQKLKRLEVLEQLIKPFRSSDDDWISTSQMQNIIAKSFAAHLTQIIIEEDKLENAKQIQHTMNTLIDFLEKIKNLPSDH